MSEMLTWQRRESVLSLQGELVHSSLLPLWQQRQQILSGIECIDLTHLSRVDSAGLALLVHLKAISMVEKKFSFSGITPPLQSLISLYNLQDILTTTLSVKPDELV